MNSSSQILRICIGIMVFLSLFLVIVSTRCMRICYSLISAFTATFNPTLTILQHHPRFESTPMMRIVRTESQPQLWPGRRVPQQLQFRIPIAAHAMRPLFRSAKLICGHRRRRLFGLRRNAQHNRSAAAWCSLQRRIGTHKLLVCCLVGG